MAAPSVIPRPASLRWRDAVSRGGPVLVALLAVGTVLTLWRREVFPTNFVGEAQSPSGLVAAPEAGRLVDLQVQLYEVVTNGQVIARLETQTDRAARLALSALAADQEIMRLRLLQDQERNDLNYLQTREDLLQQRLELAAARIRLRQAESEFERVERLYTEKIVAAGASQDSDGYEVALRDRDQLRSEVADKEHWVAELETTLTQLRPPGRTNTLENIHATIDAAIRTQEEELLGGGTSVTLRSTVDGMVMRINRRAGEYVSAGEALFEIRGTEPQWILGFIRQPIAFRPQPGDAIRVLSRGRPRREAEARVIRVGSHLEPFAQPLRARGFDASLERGLPVLIEYPSSLNLEAGELVDLLPLNLDSR